MLLIFNIVLDETELAATVYVPISFHLFSFPFPFFLSTISLKNLQRLLITMEPTLDVIAKYV